MLQRLFMLALCAMPALWADVCDGLPAGPPERADASGSNKPQSFKLSVNSGGPAFRITVRPIWQLDTVFLVGDIHTGDIEVARCQDGKRLQALPIMADQPVSYGSTFHAEDINFDGYLDFSVLTEFGASFEIRSYWVYDPASRLFVQNELTRGLGRLGASGVSKIDFDPKKHEVIMWGDICAMCGCPNMTQDQGGGNVDRYRVVNNRLILIHKQEYEIHQKGGSFQFCLLTLSDLVGGTMRVTEVRRYDAQGQRVK